MLFESKRTLRKKITELQEALEREHEEHVHTEEIKAELCEQISVLKRELDIKSSRVQSLERFVLDMHKVLDEYVKTIRAS